MEWDTLDWFERLDLQIRRGEVKGTRSILRARIEARTKTPISRTHLVKIAALCRRCDQPLDSVRLLNSIVRPRARAPVQPTAEELSEYGASLALIGADREGQGILDRVNGGKNPQALLFGSFARITRWEYESALPLLRKFISLPEISEYQRQIGQVNLAASLVLTDRWKEADAVLQPLIEKTRFEGNHLLLGNSLGILAQKFLFERNVAQAQEVLEEAFAVFSQGVGGDLLLIEKWKAITDLFAKGLTPSGQAALNRVKKKAIDQKSWETLRDCDFHLARLTGDQDLLSQVYFGTPFPSFRERIMRISGSDFSKKKRDFLRVIRVSNSRRSARLDTLSPPGLKPGQIQQRLLQILTSDFYRPLRVATVYAELFPEQYYNPISSPGVVHQAIKRLRQWIGARSIPLIIEERNGSYQILAKENIEIKVHLRSDSNSNEAWQLRFRSYALEIQRKFDLKEFSREKAAAVWAVSQRSANDYLRLMESKGLVTQVFSGPKTAYRLTSV